MQFCGVGIHFAGTASRFTCLERVLSKQSTYSAEITCYLSSGMFNYSACYSPCVVPPVSKLTGETRDSADQSIKMPILVSLMLRQTLKTLMLEASTAR